MSAQHLRDDDLIAGKPVVLRRLRLHVPGVADQLLQRFQAVPVIDVGNVPVMVFSHVFSRKYPTIPLAPIHGSSLSSE